MRTVAYLLALALPVADVLQAKEKTVSYRNWRQDLTRFQDAADPQGAEERRLERLQRRRQERALTDPYEPSRPRKGAPWLSATEMDRARAEGDL